MVLNQKMKTRVSDPPARVLHVMLQPKIAETYEPVQFRHAKNLLLDVLEDPKNHQMHAKRYGPSRLLLVSLAKTV